MKIVTILLTGLLFFTGCSTNTQTKVEKSIKRYLTEHLQNPSTYVSLKYSKVDTISQADTISKYLTFIDNLVDLENEAQERTKRMIEISYDLDKPNEKTKINFQKSNTTIDSLENVKKFLKDQALKSEVKNNLVYYKVTHEYSHKSLDNEIVNLKIDFILDRSFNILPEKISKGINGRANFEIKITCKDGGFYYTEFVVDPKLDGQLINSDGTTDLTLKAGNHYLTWTASNKNGLGILTNPETFRKELVLEDSKLTEAYFVILGKSFYSFKNEEDAISDKFYQEFIIKK